MILFALVMLSVTLVASAVFVAAVLYEDESREVVHRWVEQLLKEENKGR